MTTTTGRVRSDVTSSIKELRTASLADSDFELRAADDDGTRQFVGHAAVFNSRTSIGNPLGWGWYEEIASGAFTKTLDEGDARFLIDHDTALLVARVSAGDLRLAEDKVGLAVDSDLDTEVSYVRDFVRNVEKRRITGMSFGFYVVKDEWELIDVETTDGNTVQAELRTILETRLLEVSGVTFPAYEDTDAGLRALTAEIRAARIGSKRGVARVPYTPPDSSPRAGDASEPDDTTRSETTEPAEATRIDAQSLRPLDRRAEMLAARYRNIERTPKQ